MTIKKKDPFSGDGQLEPDDFNDPGENEPSGPHTHGSAKAYDAIAYAARTDSIKKLIEEFGLRHLSPEYIAFAFNLCGFGCQVPGFGFLSGRITRST